MRKLLSLSLILLALTSCQRADQKPKEPQERKVVVSTYTVRSEEVALEYTTKGYFEGERDVLLRPLVSGRVVSVHADEGDFVRSGQALLKVDPADYENVVRQLEAQLAQARASYENTRAVAERRRFLYERELIAREELENVQTQLKAQEEVIKSLQAQLSNARLNLSRTILTAPFSGYIAQRFVNIGDYITPQSQTFRLTTLDPIRFVFQVPQEGLAYTAEGSKVSIKVDPYGSFDSTVFFVSPVADNSRLITVKARLRNPEGKLKPGMYGEAILETAKETAFVLPEQAVVLQGNRSVVWKVNTGSAEPVEVKVIKQGKGVVYVKGDLREGDKIALENAYLLQQGMKVEVR
ncbi:MAG: efflux RND transporter periplasmic adaptor subunit [Acidobacteria bacterium]|jgi:membrane fusion protein (multidrug efflux system)|nr:MAG: efflux RND transporter periplasmic adaptor subunit [Acidobacteriota bacterium]